MGGTAAVIPTQPARWWKRLSCPPFSLLEPEVHVTPQEQTASTSQWLQAQGLFLAHTAFPHGSAGGRSGTQANEQPPSGNAHCYDRIITRVSQVAHWLLELLPRSETCHLCSHGVGLVSHGATRKVEKAARTVPPHAGNAGPELLADRCTAGFSELESAQKKTCPWKAPTCVCTLVS